MLLRRVIGDALRARRQAQHRTLREVSTSANVSLGYLSEIERGQKEASSELLAAICEALGAALSEVLRDVSNTLALSEDLPPAVLVPVGAPEPTPDEGSGANAAPAQGEAGAEPQARLVRRGAPKTAVAPKAKVAADAKLSVAVHHDGPLRTTLRATRGQTDRSRDIVLVA